VTKFVVELLSLRVHLIPKTENTEHNNTRYNTIEQNCMGQDKTVSERDMR
jgi:hypothetical protein